MEPPEMAVFSFIDLPDVLTHEKKGEHIVKKKEKNQVNIKTTIRSDQKSSLDINGNQIDPKRRYIGKKIKSNPLIRIKIKKSWILMVIQ